MINYIIDNGETIAAFIAIIVSSIALVYARNNIKITKYIETITEQRIRWIEIVRNDLSSVISDLSILCYISKYHSELYDFDMNVGFDSAEESRDAYDHSKNLKEINIKKTTIKLINKIDISLFKLNSNEDQKAIKLLKSIEDKILRENFIEIIDENQIEDLSKEITKILKREWEKVKIEVKKGNVIARSDYENWN